MHTPGLRQQLTDRIRRSYRPLLPQAVDAAQQLTAMSDIRCVAFDVYGTLLISGAGELAAGSGAAEVDDRSRWDAWEAVAAELGLHGPAAPGELAAAWKTALADAHRRARRAGRVQPEVDVRSLWSEIAREQAPDWQGRPAADELALAYELAANPTALMPGARETVDALRAAGVQLAIVSNAQFYTPLILETLTDCPIEELIPGPRIWSWELGAAKPDPLLFQRLLAELAAGGIEPEQTLYVGNDMLNDVMAAATAGVRTALFAGDGRSLRLRSGDPRVAGVLPDAVVTRLDQIPALIAS